MTATPARTTAPDRVARLLAVIPWIAARDGPTLAEVCERFGVSRRKLEEDLTILTLVGVPPYTPDTLIEVTIEGDRVWLRFADVFARPLHLTPEQAVALVAAGAASQSLPGGDGEGPLASALAKLAGVLGLEPGETLSVALGDTRPDVLEALRGAVAEHRRVRLDYYAYGKDRRSTREVDPAGVFAHEGFWYLRGWCHRADDHRLFRVDRIVEAEVLDETFDPPAGGGGREVDVFYNGPEIPRVTLDVGPSARWVVETYPVDRVTVADDGRLRIRLPVTAAPWLERLLVRLGAEARVVESDDPELVDAGRRAARRILRRYGVR
ncbi:MAG TPA: WYL domain-containing protein [Acidimicrobiales bacterium]|nr:WYL domain-containing protein [Acidimicrobiales bacterium]